MANVNYYEETARRALEAFINELWIWGHEDQVHRARTNINIISKEQMSMMKDDAVRKATRL